MKVALVTLCLNEMEWLPRLYSQHHRWPNLVKWVFVEAADQQYAYANPTMVTPRGLSVDGTSAYLEQLQRYDTKVQHIKHGFTGHTDPAQGKCAARNRYIAALRDVDYDLMVVLDADEFYCHKDQDYRSTVSVVAPRMRHLWGDTGSEVTGAYWDVPHFRFWLRDKRMQYMDNHNWPLSPHAVTFRNTNAVQCVHMGFAGTVGATRVAKNKYYVARGEGKQDGRQMYVDCRRAHELGTQLPHGAKVIPYTGPLPECFQ